MAYSASIPLLFYALCISLCIQSAVSQTFQYSRGWTNGKRAGTASIPQLKAAQQMINVDDIPDMCKYNKINTLYPRNTKKQTNQLREDVSTDSPIYLIIHRQFFLAEILLLGKPICFYAQHSANYYQQPQIQPDIDFMSPISSSHSINVATGAAAPVQPAMQFDSNGRYKRYADWMQPMHRMIAVNGVSTQHTEYY